MRCNQCGANLKRNMTFCNQCGAKAEAAPFSLKGFFSQFFTKKSEKQAGQNQPENSGESTENSRIQGGSIWGKRAKLIYTASAVVLLAGGIAGGYFYENQQILNRQATSKQKEEEKDSRAKEEYQKIEKLESEIKDFVAKAEEEKRIAYEKANPKFPVEEKDLEIIWIPQEVMDRYDYIGYQVVNGMISVGKYLNEESYFYDYTSYNDTVSLITKDMNGADATLKYGLFYTYFDRVLDYGTIDINWKEVIPCVYRSKRRANGKGYQTLYLDIFSEHAQEDINGKHLQDRPDFGSFDSEEDIRLSTAEYYNGIFPYVWGEGNPHNGIIFHVQSAVKEGLVPFSTEVADIYGYGGQKNIGFIDEFGNIIVPAVFDKVEYFSDGYAYVEKDGKKGFLKNPLPEERRK